MSHIKLEQNFNFRYEEFSEIGRTLHIDDLQENISKETLLYYSKHKIGKTNIPCLWFKPALDCTSHDWYGNVCFQIDFMEILEFFEYMYWVDIKRRTKSFTSTVLVSHTSLPTNTNSIPSTKFHKRGFPLMINNQGQIFHASTLHKLPHIVEFGIAYCEEDASWLYDNCRRIAVNHNEANTLSNDNYKHRICFKYNKNGYRCPFSQTKDETSIQISVKHPGFLSLYNESNKPGKSRKQRKSKRKNIKVINDENTDKTPTKSPGSISTKKYDPPKESYPAVRSSSVTPKTTQVKSNVQRPPTPVPQVSKLNVPSAVKPKLNYQNVDTFSRIMQPINNTNIVKNSNSNRTDPMELYIMLNNNINNKPKNLTYRNDFDRNSDIKFKKAIHNPYSSHIPKETHHSYTYNDRRNLIDNNDINISLQDDDNNDNETYFNNTNNDDSDERNISCCTII